MKNKTKNLRPFIYLVTQLLICFTVVAQSKNVNFNGIEKKIDDAFIKSFIANNTNDLDKINQEIGTTNNALSQYWSAYSLYLKSLYYQSKGATDQAEESLTAGINKIKGSKQSSESYALLGTMQNFSIQFASMMKAATIAEEATSNFQKALKLDPKNLRAYLGLGLQDYYTPIEFGGQNKVVEYLNKAISLPNQSTANPTMPSWGKNEAYHTLVSYYIKQKNSNKAKQIYKEATTKFPNDYRLLSLSKDLL